MSLDNKEKGFTKLRDKLKTSMDKLVSLQPLSSGNDLVKVNSLIQTAELYDDFCNEVLKNEVLPLTNSLRERAEQINNFCKIIDQLKT